MTRKHRSFIHAVKNAIRNVGSQEHLGITGLWNAQAIVKCGRETRIERIIKAGENSKEQTKQTTRIGTESQKWRSHGGYQL